MAITNVQCNALRTAMTVALHEKYVKDHGHGLDLKSEELVKKEMKHYIPEACKTCYF